MTEDNDFSYKCQNDFKMSVYSERAACVALIAKMAMVMGYTVGLKKDDGALVAFMQVSNVIYIDLPAGQVSWHIADQDMHRFGDIPPYEGEWDGHTTTTKYHRIDYPNLPIDFPDAIMSFLQRKGIK